MLRKMPKPKTPNPVVTINFGELSRKQAMFCASRARYTAYGGARGGGKSHVIRIKAVGGALQWPGIKILMLRRTYPDLEGSVIGPMLKMLPMDISAYNATMHVISFANGSTIKFGHYNSATSAMEYQGQEFDWIFIDEATQFTEDEFRVLGACLRGVNDIPKRFYLTCNPGGIGHQWVKRLFIDKDYRTGCKNPEENEDPADYKFIQALVEDNEHLMQAAPDYVKMLMSLPENVRRAHRYGDWDALGGSYFPEFRSDTHVIDDIAVPSDWIRYRAFDYGLDMFACYWIAVDYDGRAYVYREFKMSNLIVSDAAQMMHHMTLPGERIAVTFAPPDMWIRQKDGGKTMAELFMQNGISIVRANNARVHGWLQLKEMLKIQSDGKPGLLFCRNCEGIIKDLAAIQADEHNPNDCAKEPHNITHGPDAIRYFVQSRSLPSIHEEPARRDYDDDDYEEDYDDFMTGGSASASYMNYSRSV